MPFVVLTVKHVVIDDNLSDEELEKTIIPWSTTLSEINKMLPSIKFDSVYEFLNQNDGIKSSMNTFVEKTNISVMYAKMVKDASADQRQQWINASKLC